MTPAEFQRALLDRQADSQVTVKSTHVLTSIDGQQRTVLGWSVHIYIENREEGFSLEDDATVDSTNLSALFEQTLKAWDEMHV